VQLPSNLEAKLSSIARRDRGENEEDQEANEDEDELEFMDEDEDAPRRPKKEKPVGELFANLKFFVAREVPRDALQFIILCCGGQVSWEGEHAPYPESDESITHHVVDRPSQTHRFLSRQYVQPQWVADCVNARFLLPVDEYLPGVSLPPHLSPFVDLEKTNYVPKRAHEIQALKEGKSVAELDKEEEMAVEESDEEEDDLNEEEAEARYQEELEKEREGISFSAAAAGKEKKRKTKKQEAEELKKEEEKTRNHLRSIMIEKKKHRQLYNKVKKVQKHSAESRVRLEKKAKAFNEAQKKAGKA
jgi:pescadillo protein